MNDNVTTFLANLKHDIRNNQSVEVGSGIFSGQELVDVANALASAVPDEDIEDIDGRAIQAAYDLISVILKADPGVYDEIASPVMLLLDQRLSSSWRDQA